MEPYEKKMMMLDVLSKLAVAQNQVDNGQVIDADTAIQNIRETYNV